MRTPPGLLSLLEDGLIEAVLRPMQSGKEALVYLVLAGGEPRVAKIYKGANERNFKHRSEYAEGRGTRNTRDQRAMKNRSRYGRSRDEEAWQATEVEMMYRLREAGVRVPAPLCFSDGVLIMELVQDEHGAPAPRLGDIRVSAEEAVAIHDALLRDVVRMLCAGVVHGDLSEFNVLVDTGGPVIIDLPQAVEAARNPNARKLLLRDVENLQRFATRWVPGRRRLSFGAEMWALYERNELEPDTELSGLFEGPQGKADTSALLDLIDDAEEDERRRRTWADGPSRSTARREPRVVVNKAKRTKKRTSSATAPPPPPPTRSKGLSLSELIARATAPPAAKVAPGSEGASTRSRPTKAKGEAPTGSRSEGGDARKDPRRGARHETRREPRNESRREPPNETRRGARNETRREPPNESRREPRNESRREPPNETRREPRDETRRGARNESRRGACNETRREPANQTRGGARSEGAGEARNQARGNARSASTSRADAREDSSPRTRGAPTVRRPQDEQHSSRETRETREAREAPEARGAATRDSAQREGAPPKRRRRRRRRPDSGQR